MDDAALGSKLARELEVRCIVADGDLDGLATAAILRVVWPGAEIRFAHPAEVRAGKVDAWMGAHTAVVDLPFHPGCGLYIDHHQTNRPDAQTEAAFDGTVVWRPRLSAARVAYDLFCEVADLSGVAAWMDMIDRLDGGRITPAELFSDHPVVRIGRAVDPIQYDFCMDLADAISDGIPPETAIERVLIASSVAAAQAEFEGLRSIIEERLRIEDRLAILRLDGETFRTNGYLVTAVAGDACEACVIVHGQLEGEVGDRGRWPLSASFYSNSFLHTEGGIFDLTAFATAFDIDGGGHANACGCRIQPLAAGATLGAFTLEERRVETSDIERNLAAWQAAWAAR